MIIITRKLAKLHQTGAQEDQLLAQATEARIYIYACLHESKRIFVHLPTATCCEAYKSPLHPLRDNYSHAGVRAL